MVREIIAYKDYYRDFMDKLGEKERMKIRRALLLKTQKTPRSEIAKAKRLKKEYYEDKNADIQCK